MIKTMATIKHTSISLIGGDDQQDDTTAKIMDKDEDMADSQSLVTQVVLNQTLE